MTYYRRIYKEIARIKHTKNFKLAQTVILKRKTALNVKKDDKIQALSY